MTKIIKISLLPIVLVLLSMCLFGCSAKVDALKVYDTIFEYADESNNIFKVDTIQNELEEDTKIITVKIGYTENINNKLLVEQQTYEQTHNPTSDFYLLKEIYEPTLNFSLNFFLKNINFLQSSNKAIKKDDAGAVYDKFTNLKKSIESFQRSLANLNYYDNAFTSQEYADKKSMVYKQLDGFKTKYGLLIKDCFELNNQFIKLYYTIYAPTDYRVESKALEGLYVQLLCSEVAAKLSYVGFLVDGVKCNFSNTNKSSFEIENEASIIDHTYIKHFTKISNTTQSLISKTGEDFQALDNNDSVKALVQILQNQLDIFDAQYDKFINALNKVNYKNYVASNKTLDEYANTLSDKEKSNLYVVEDFLDNIYTSLASELATVMENV